MKQSKIHLNITLNNKFIMKETFTPKSSSAISYTVYNSEKQDLTVYFTNGYESTYTGVPNEVYESFKTSDSKGKFFNENIKNAYSFY